MLGCGPLKGMVVMRICIYGAGAVGGFIGVKLALDGHDVTMIGRGTHFDAMAKDGARLISAGEEVVAHPRCVADPKAAGPQDYVFVTMKAHSLPVVAADIQPLLGPKTPVVSIQNGVPWWYFHGLGGDWEGHNLTSIDPGGRLWRAIGPGRAIGCAVTTGCAVAEPGVIRHRAGRRLEIGEPDGTESERCRELSAMLTAAGFEAPVKTRIRDALWYKLWGNLSFSMISVLTGAALAPMTRDAGATALARRLMEEAQAVGEAMGARFATTIGQRIIETAEMGDHKPSTLQDFERGRPLEIDALIGAVAEMGRLAQIPTPEIDMVYGLVRLKAMTAGCYPENPAFTLFDGREASP